MNTDQTFACFAVKIPATENLQSKMKKLLLLAALFLGACSLALAQTVAVVSTGNPTADSILTWLTPVIVPLIIAGVKKVLPSLPTVLLPVLGPVLGAVLDIINHVATGASTNLWAALALGAAGVGLREVVDQVKQATTPSQT
jgi:hypothetical protein